MSHLLGTSQHAQVVLLVIVVVFVLVPLALRLSLKLLEPDLEGRTPLRRAFERLLGRHASRA